MHIQFSYDTFFASMSDNLESSGIEERMHLVWNTMVVSCTCIYFILSEQTIKFKFSYESHPKISNIQESGQISVSDYVRITSAEWYVVLFEILFFFSLINKNFVTCKEKKLFLVQKKREKKVQIVSCRYFMTSRGTSCPFLFLEWFCIIF